MHNHEELSGREHYSRAEQLIKPNGGRSGTDTDIARAQVHALLALSAALAPSIESTDR